MGSTDIDFYVIGFQEIVDLTAVNVAVDTKSQKQSQFWQEKIEEILEYGKYRQVVARHLVGLLICVYARDTLYPFLRDLRCTTAGVGVMGVMGNKGGISVHLQLHDCTVCLVCSHLAAHRENVAGRNADYQSIIEKTSFSFDSIIPLQNQIESNKDAANLRSLGLGPPDAADLKIIDHDMVFWMGDLNYRIDESVSMEDVFMMVEDKDLSTLRERDQLNLQRKYGHVFHNFLEGELCFDPTYKVK